MTAIDLAPRSEHLDLVCFECTCRRCGERLEPLALAATDGCVASLPVKCTNCHRSYVVRAEMIAVTDPSKDGRYA